VRRAVPTTHFAAMRAFQPVDADLEGFLAARADARMAALDAFLRIPSVSALPDHAADCRRVAAWLAGHLAAIGLEHVELCETDRNPVVYADWLRVGPDAPTVLVYGHYDVQPPDPEDEWERGPFEPLVRDGRILGRGAADDKGQILAHIAAVEALLAVRGGPPVNLRYAFEGDEEAGTGAFVRWLAGNRERLAADIAVDSDGTFFDGNLPALTVSLRGLLYAQVDVTGPTVDLHSGSHGGAVENPALALARILAGLKALDGTVRIPGFYDDVVTPASADRAALAALPFDEEAYRRELGVPELAGEPGWTVLERRGLRPTLDVNGIWGGFQGEGAKTIIPARASAKISCRLVPAQDPDRIFDLFRDHVASLAPTSVRVAVRSLGGDRSCATAIDHPATQACARALEATFGRPPLFVREGGGNPACAAIQEQLGAQLVLLGLANPDCNAHAPNESLDMANFEGGIRAVIRAWEGLASVRAAP
jgi:acetylornithine deacetylase/succinyl-diaminopimelate desuccinylase-like protein